MWSQRAIACQFALLKELNQTLSEAYNFGWLKHKRWRGEKDIFRDAKFFGRYILNTLSC